MMEFLIIGIIAIFTSVGASALINNKNENKKHLTYEQGEQLAQRIKATEQKQINQEETSHKLNNKILAQSQEFNNYDAKRGHKLKEIEQKIDIINLRLQEQGKNKITNKEAQELLKDIPKNFNELEDIEQKLTKLKKNSSYTIKI